MNRNRRVAISLLAIGLWLALRVATVAAAPLVSAVDTIGFTVADADRSAAFFHDVLSFEKVSDVEIAGEAYENLVGVFGARMRVVRMTLGDESIALTEYLAPRGRPIPVDSHSNDQWFQHIAIVTSDMKRAYQHLRTHRVEHASTGPQRLPDWNANAAGIEAFYFKDPDGHPLEVIAFPKGKGDPRWQRASDQLFRGIDHTAIVVRDSERSLELYRDQLGLAEVGHSENYGTEQEHLNNVFGARLRITSLRAARGPGIELLEYLAPRDGRPTPADLHANDLAHWQTTLSVTNVAETLSAVRRHTTSVSPSPVALPDPKLRSDAAALVRDPDGHGLLLTQ